MTQYILGIEFQSLGIREIPPDLFSPIPTIKIYVDEYRNYHFATGIEEVKQAIVDIIPHLGSNYRHPILFDVQIFPGDEIDAYLNSIGSGVPTGYPRRRKTR